MPDRADVGASAAAVVPAAVRRRSRRDGRRAASSRETAPHLAVADPGAAPATLLGRPRARRSGQTSRAPCPRGAPAPSASAAPAPAARRRQAAHARASWSAAGNPPTPTTARRQAPTTRPRARHLRRRRSARPIAVRPRRQRPPSTTACVRPHRSRSSPSPPQPLGATGKRTDLNRGSSHAPIRSRSAVSGRRRRHNAGKSTLGATRGNRVSRHRPESCTSTGHHRHPGMTVSARMSLERGAIRTGGAKLSYASVALLWSRRARQARSCRKRSIIAFTCSGTSSW